MVKRQQFWLPCSPWAWVWSCDDVYICLLLHFVVSLKLWIFWETDCFLNKALYLCGDVYAVGESVRQSLAFPPGSKSHKGCVFNSAVKIPLLWQSKIAHTLEVKLRGTVAGKVFAKLDWIRQRRLVNLRTSCLALCCQFRLTQVFQRSFPFSHIWLSYVLKSISDCVSRPSPGKWSRSSSLCVIEKRIWCDLKHCSVHCSL